MKRVAMLLVGLVGLFAVATPSAHATIIDLTAGDPTAFYGLNGALFVWVDAAATGTGLIDSFVQIGGTSSVVQAYNTTVNGVLDNGSSSTFNHALLLSNVPVFNLSGTTANGGTPYSGTYYEFLLDINQTGDHPLESLDEIQVLTSSTANQSVTSFNGSGIINLTNNGLAYRLDAGGDNYIKLDYSLNHGSGSGDMFMYIPTSAFGSGPDVYLYSKFGLNFANNDGFEEWAVRKNLTCDQTNTCTPPPPPPVVPEPTSMLLMGSGLLACLGFGWSRKRV